MKTNWKVFLIVGALIAVYLLLEGPMYSMLRRKVVSQRAYSFVYNPLVFIYNRNDSIARLFNWYDKLWYKEETIFDYLNKVQATNGFYQPKNVFVEGSNLFFIDGTNKIKIPK